MKEFLTPKRDPLNRLENREPVSREGFVSKRLPPNIEMPRLKWLKREAENREPPNVVPPKRELGIPAPLKAELPNRDPPNTEPLRAAKFDSARDGEIAEFSPPLVQGAPNERVPDKNPSETEVPPRAAEVPPNERQPVEVIAELRAPPLIAEPNPRPEPLVDPAERPDDCPQVAAMAEMLLLPDGPNRAFDVQKSRPLIPRAP